MSPQFDNVFDIDHADDILGHSIEEFELKRTSFSSKLQPDMFSIEREMQNWDEFLDLWLKGIRDPEMDKAICKDLELNASHYRMNDRYQQFCEKIKLFEAARLEEQREDPLYIFSIEKGGEKDE